MNGTSDGLDWPAHDVTIVDLGTGEASETQHPGGPMLWGPASTVMYECGCCERRNVPQKLKGIGYVCDDCFTSWEWDYGWYPPEQDPLNHHAGRTCPFRAAAEGAT